MPQQDDASTQLEVRSTVLDPHAKPDLNSALAVVLREGPRSKKTARFFKIRDRNTGAFHHDSVTIETVKKLKAGDAIDEKRTVTLSSEDGVDEIQRLIDFLNAARNSGISEKTGRYLLVQGVGEEADAAAIHDIISQIQESGNYQVLAQVAREVGSNPALLRTLIERADKHPQLFAEAAAALNLATYRAALEKLRGYVELHESREQKYQELLALNPWMFGSEFSQLLPRRHWTRGERADFVMRRTTDGFVEIVEIKTPLDGRALFRFDDSHDSHFPSQELSKVIGQVMKYIEELDADRLPIKARDCEDTAKIRAKIIIGTDGDEEQIKALHRLNGHLHRIEIITFDQLVAIAENAVRYLSEILYPVGDDNTVEAE